MAKILKQRTRIQIYGGDNNEIMAYALIAFDEKDNDSIITIVRAEKKKIPRLLRKYGYFTRADMEKILSLKFKQQWNIDNGYGLIIRMA